MIPDIFDHFYSGSQHLSSLLVYQINDQCSIITLEMSGLFLARPDPAKVEGGSMVAFATVRDDFADSSLSENASKSIRQLTSRIQEGVCFGDSVAASVTG